MGELFGGGEEIKILENKCKWQYQAKSVTVTLMKPQW
jgi:hypothetical protein